MIPDNVKNAEEVPTAEDKINKNIPDPTILDQPSNDDKPENVEIPPVSVRKLAIKGQNTTTISNKDNLLFEKIEDSAGNADLINLIVYPLDQLTYISNDNKPKSSKKEGINSKPTISLRQIALIYAYNSEAITRKNGDEIAKKYGHNSGDRLYNLFSFHSATNRKAKPNPCTKLKFKNKIELFESVIQHLDGKAKQLANNEIDILKDLYKKEFD